MMPLFRKKRKRRIPWIPLLLIALVVTFWLGISWSQRYTLLKSGVRDSYDFLSSAASLDSEIRELEFECNRSVVDEGTVSTLFYLHKVFSGNVKRHYMLLEEHCHYLEGMIIGPEGCEREGLLLMFNDNISMEMYFLATDALYEPEMGNITARICKLAERLKTESWEDYKIESRPLRMYGNAP